MTLDEVYKYFIEKYKDCKVRVVPGHWPDFKTQDEVDKWIDFNNRMPEIFEKLKDTPLDDDDDF